MSSIDLRCKSANVEIWWRSMKRFNRLDFTISSEGRQTISPPNLNSAVSGLWDCNLLIPDLLELELLQDHFRSGVRIGLPIGDFSRPRVDIILADFLPEPKH